MFTILDFDNVAGRVQAGEKIVVVEDSPDYVGNLTFGVMEDMVGFARTYSEYLSPYCVLNELFLLGPFLEKLEGDGWEVVFMPECQAALDQYARHSQELIVEGLKLGSGLFPFQQYDLNQALERMPSAKQRQTGYFFNWSPGAGKGTAAAAGAQELLVNRQEVDLVLFFTLRKMKTNMARRVEALTDLVAEVVDGTAAKRKKRYAAAEAHCYLLNYEKAHFDQGPLIDLIHGKRVLFILDETQKILYGENGSPTRARYGLEKLIHAGCKRAIVWAMSATVVKSSPLRYHDVFRVQEMNGRNPLGTKESFLNTYAKEIEEIEIPGTNRSFTVIDWNKQALAEIPHLVAGATGVVRKTSPGVREFFQDMTTQVIDVQMSPEDRKLYEQIKADARKNPTKVMQYYALLRHVCNTPESLERSDSPLAAHYLATYPELITSKNSSKMETVCEQLEQIVAAGDKAVVFCSRTHMGLFLISEELDRRKINHVNHYGTGMSDKQAQAAQDRFMEDPECSVFLSSDAGASGLNLQVARYVLNYDCPYDPDMLTQRNDRIDRADSHLTGLTAYVFITEDTIEERIWETQEERRQLSGITQGTVENLSRLDSSAFAQLDEDSAAGSLIFGRDSLVPR